MGEAIKTLSEGIATLLSYTVKNSEFISNISQFLSDIGKASNSPNQFVQHFHKWFKLRNFDSGADSFGKHCSHFYIITQTFNSHFEPQKSN